MSLKRLLGLIPANEIIGKTYPKGESLTQQEFKDDCDINLLMKKYRNYGVVPRELPPAIYADVSNVPSFHEAADFVAKTKEAFESLPALVRRRFRENPAELVDFVKNEANRDEAMLLGLIPKKPVESPATVPTGGETTP